MNKRIGTLALTTLCIASALPGSQLLAECRHFSSSELRRMAIQQVIRIGVTQQQVERSWGKPSRKISNSDGDIWEYWNPAGDQLVEFGLDGCVSRWWTVRE